MNALFIYFIRQASKTQVFRRLQIYIINSRHKYSITTARTKKGRNVTSRLFKCMPIRVQVVTSATDNVHLICR